MIFFPTACGKQQSLLPCCTSSPDLLQRTRWVSSPTEGAGSQCQCFPSSSDAQKLLLSRHLWCSEKPQHFLSLSDHMTCCSISEVQCQLSSVLPWENLYGDWEVQLHPPMPHLIPPVPRDPPPAGLAQTMVGCICFTQTSALLTYMYSTLE